MNLSRRDLLRAAPLAAGVAATAGLHPRFAAARADGLIVRMQEPRNLETPLADLLPRTTANEKFYVRSHFAVPAVDPKAFTLTVDGHVGKKLELTLDELKKMGAVTRENILECAGNGRVFLVPAGRGLQWGYGAVGNAEWTGVPLGAILERAGVKAGAADVVLVGADRGTIADPATPGAIHFDRSLPLAKAKADETVLAWEMNGAPLPAAHGGPLRAVIGGWYGMASVKWLTRVVVTDKPHTGFWQTMDYSHWQRGPGGLPQLVPVTDIQPKAVVLSPGLGDVLPAGKPVTVRGRAWAGAHGVKAVALDAGGKAVPTKLTEGAKPFGWTAWEATWTPGEKGPVALVARCTDAAGRTQPDKRDPDRRTYMINHLVPVEVTVG